MRLGNMNIQPLKNSFPFRLGTTSFIRPAGYADNVAFLAPLVDDVELLFFESKPQSLPKKQEVEKLRRLKTEHDISYTLHLPLDLHPGSEDETLRHSSMETCCRLVAETAILEPLAWILHVPAAASGESAEWHFESMERSIDTLAKEGLARTRLCLETLDYPFIEVLEMAERHATSLCIDLGHLVLHGYAVEECLDSCLKRCRVVHFHGLRKKQDHQEISLLSPDLRHKIITALAKWGNDDRVLTLEVFGHDAFVDSIETMRGYLQ